MLFSSGMADLGWLKLNHLFSLGFQQKHIYFIAIFLGVSVCYAVMKPVITWFVKLGSIRLLSFLTSGLMVVLAFFVIVLYVGELPDIMLSLLKITLQCLAVWGIIIVLYHSVRLAIKK